MNFQWWPAGDILHAPTIMSKSVYIGLREWTELLYVWHGLWSAKSYMYRYVLGYVHECPRLCTFPLIVY